MIEQRVLEQNGEDHSKRQKEVPFQNFSKRKHDGNEPDRVRHRIPKAANVRRSFSSPGQLTINRIDHALDNQKQTRHDHLFLENQPSTEQREKEVEVCDLNHRYALIFEKEGNNSGNWPAPIR